MFWYVISIARKIGLKSGEPSALILEEPREVSEQLPEAPPVQLRQELLFAQQVGGLRGSRNPVSQWFRVGFRAKIHENLSKSCLQADSEGSELLGQLAALPREALAAGAAGVRHRGSEHGNRC